MPTLSDVKATADELLAHVDEIHASTEDSLSLSKRARRGSERDSVHREPLRGVRGQREGTCRRREARIEEPMSEADRATLSL